MLRSPLLRAVLLVAVLGAQFGLLLWGGALVGSFDDPYPNEYAIALDYDRHVGREVTVTAEVVSTDPLVVYEAFQYKDVRLTVDGADVDASVGDRLAVFGVLQPDGRLEAIRAYTVPDSGLRYAYAVSALAGLWVLVRLVRGWRVDTDGWGLAPREEREGGARDA
jgi:hypothetical protein